MNATLNPFSSHFVLGVEGTSTCAFSPVFAPAGPVCDFGTERALAEPLGPNTTNFPSSCPRFTLLTELNLSLKARPEAHTSDFIGSGQGPFVTLEQNGLWQSL